MRAAAAVAALLALLLASPAAGQFVANGNFDMEGSGNFPLMWTIGGAGAISSTTFNEARSQPKAVLFGYGKSTLSQDITGLTAGASYTVGFWLKTGITNLSGFSVDINGAPTSILGPGVQQTAYTYHSVNFQAKGTTMTLTFIADVTLAKKKDIAFGYALDDVTVGTCSVCGDPHIVGLDNSRYDFMGEPGMVFALLSEPSVQLNSRFVEHGKGTAIGPLCIRTCQHTLEIYPNHTVIVDGKLRAQATKSVAGKSEHLGKDLVMTRYNARMTWLSFGAWSMLLQHGKYNFNIINLKHHADHDTEELHGVYGMSAIPNHHQHDKKHCQPWKNGGCELIGKWQDYALADQTGLCGAEWTYSKFDPKKC